MVGFYPEFIEERHLPPQIETGETQLTINRLTEISEIDPIEVLGFDHQNIFNNCTQEGNYNTIGKSIYQMPDKLVEQHEKRIQQLESEVTFLRTLVK